MTNVEKVEFLAQRCRWPTVTALATFVLVSCAVSPETQAKIDEYARTIPSCTSDSECDRKWALARTWTLQNSDFNIRGESETRINANSNVISQSGIGVVVTKVSNGSNGFQILADLECFSANSCPELWDLKVDFNQTVNGSSK
ncbi:MAG: hypothetical protein COB20_02970 [SAR86 cluster bacterium]|uniref:Lipoprotein n=1 Tax=SAR86 cluster bacterium TaxID=2030880 RepID=A0A2A4XDA3_9GAMM|nr:MAG: hypothetical protein COB20_02970 [SAR86 cluster bacterium]